MQFNLSAIGRGNGDGITLKSVSVESSSTSWNVVIATTYVDGVISRTWIEDWRWRRTWIIVGLRAA